MTPAQTATPARATGVQSVERAVGLLEHIAAAGGERSLSELSGETGLPLPTIHRLVRTLVGLGYARQLPNRNYALGPRLIHLGEVANRQVGSLARPALLRLVEQLGETANLAMLDDDRATYAAQVPSPHAMRMYTEVGTRVPLHYSGAGKIFLASMPDDDAVALVSRVGFAAPTAKTITTATALRSALDQVRQQGYAMDDEEQELGVRCVAVAVPATSGSPMAVSISGPTSRITDELVTTAVPALRTAAENIARAIAG
ncbi:MAG: IclR family transcriptional regulator [Galactobacter sp.]